MYGKSQALVVHTYNPNCSRGRDQEDHRLRPACAENLHFMLNGETRRAPRPPVARAQMAWEDTDKVS
jgi:hypothetical protein